MNEVCCICGNKAIKKVDDTFLDYLCSKHYRMYLRLRK